MARFKLFKRSAVLPAGVDTTDRAPASTPLDRRLAPALASVGIGGTEDGEGSRVGDELGDEVGGTEDGGTEDGEGSRVGDGLGDEVGGTVVGCGAVGERSWLGRSGQPLRPLPGRRFAGTG